MKRFYLLENDSLIDTKANIPHVECYVENNNKLYAEQIDGTIYLLGKICKRGDEIEDFIS